MYNPRIEDLREALNALPLRNVAEAKAFIVDLRRAIEPSKKTHDTLWFFCSWALHSGRMRGMPENFKELTTLFDVRDGMSAEEYLDTNYMKRAMGLHPFRHALSSFLKANDLPRKLTIETGHWVNFVDLFMDIVQNVSLDLSRDATAAADDVKDLTIWRQESPDGLPTLTVWAVSRGNGLQYQATHVYDTSFRKL